MYLKFFNEYKNYKTLLTTVPRYTSYQLSCKKNLRLDKELCLFGGGILSITASNMSSTPNP